jgi:ABC-type dipeptide/oligopeptide/nickel transport system permease component
VAVVGVGLGVIAALRQNSVIDYLALGLATIGAATPNFVVGIILIVIFSLGLEKLTGGAFLLPAGGWGFDERLIMPVITLAFLPLAYVARLTRASTLETLRQDYVRTAQAKGVVNRNVVLKHVLRNSLIPVVTTLGPTFAFLITGSFVVERIFQIPGIGRMFVDSIQGRDYPVILATTILFTIVIALVNLLVDILYVFIDPRVRLID